MKTTIAMLAAVSLLTFAVPLAAAEPDCLQVYPWSELCEGDVDGFLDGVGVGDALPCAGKDCVSANCIQVYPWSEMCGGGVRGFLCAVLRCDLS